MSKVTETKANAVYEEDEDTKGTTTAGAVDPDDLDVEFGDERLTSGTGLQKAIPEKGKTARVNLLSDWVKPKMAYVHFIPDKGSYRCLSKRDSKGNILGKPAICCVKTANNDKAKAQLIVAVLALQYTNASSKDGKYYKATGSDAVPAIEYDIKWVKLSRSGSVAIGKLPEEDQLPCDIDVAISWKATGIGFDYNKLSKARFRLNPDLVAEVKAACEPYLDGKLLIERLGKKVTEAEMAALFAGVAAATAAEAQVESVDDI
jgi:hypothetical protein